MNKRSILSKYILTLLFCIILNQNKAQNYSLNDLKSKITFSINNFGIKTNGSFSELKGTIVFLNNDLNKSKVILTANARSINTNNKTRDKHLKKEDYFNTEIYPQITFTSSNISKGKLDKQYLMKGLLSIKGKVKNIEILFETTSSSIGILFTGQFTINRRDFDVGGSSISLSDNVIVDFNILAN